MRTEIEAYRKRSPSRLVALETASVCARHRLVNNHTRGPYASVAVDSKGVTNMLFPFTSEDRLPLLTRMELWTEGRSLRILEKVRAESPEEMGSRERA